MHSSLLGLPALLLPLLHPITTSALGINCRGSGLCRLATWENSNSVSIDQILRNAIWESSLPNSTVYHSGDHVICISGKQSISLTGSASQETEGGQTATGSFTLSGTLHTGGICVFPQCDNCELTLGDIRPLMDALLEHGCGTCGSVPVEYVTKGSNDPSPGILTANYVNSPACIGNCIGASGNATNPTAGQGGSETAARKRGLVRSAKFIDGAPMMEE